MNPPHTLQSSLAKKIVDGIDAIIQESTDATKPLEVDPYRSRLFELFVTAQGAGFLDEDSPNDLTADGLCRQLSARWGLGEAARSSIEQQQRMSQTELGQMRQLWSVMRMWMEWDYAWERWPEFHADEQPGEPQVGA